MKKIFEEFGSVIVVVVAVVTLIALVAFLTRPGGIVDAAFQNLVASFSGK